MIRTTQPSNPKQLYFNPSTVLNVPNNFIMEAHQIKTFTLKWKMTAWRSSDSVSLLMTPPCCSPSYLFAMSPLITFVCMDKSLKMIPILWTKKKVLNPSASSFFITRRGKTKEFLTGKQLQIQMMAQQKKGLLGKLWLFRCLCSH